MTTEVRYIKVPIEGATEWECGECQHRVACAFGVGCCSWLDEKGTYVKIGDSVSFPLSRLPSCLFAETGILGYRRGEEGERCKECVYVSPAWAKAGHKCYHDARGYTTSPVVSSDGTCPRFEKKG